MQDHSLTSPSAQWRRRGRRSWAAVAASAVALALATIGASAPAQAVNVLTQNQYLGADFAALTQVPPAQFNATLVGVLKAIAATRFPDRAALQARSIVQRQADLVALQEAWQIGCIDLGPTTPGKGCNDPSIAGAFNDYLQVTLNALAQLGGNYSAAAFVINFNTSGFAGIPFVINGFPALLQFADRDVILVNNGTASNVQPVSFPSPPCRPSGNGCNYNIVLPVSVTVPVNGGSVTLDTALERGYVGVDATVGGTRYRFVTTHLEVKDPPVPREFQCAQALELLGVLGATTPPGVSLLVAGDFNSSPDDSPVPGVVQPTPPGLPPAIAATCFGQSVAPPYFLLTQVGGLSDIWGFRTGPAAHRPPRVDGYTCCQAANLRNNASRLSERIDLILSLAEPALVLGAQVVGDTVPEKTFPYGVGVWPSDHGGVVAGITSTVNVARVRAARAQLVAQR